jgi:hypothetical protein
MDEKFKCEIVIVAKASYALSKLGPYELGWNSASPVIENSY